MTVTIEVAEKIQIGWIDYSNEHRNKVMAVLHALSAPDAVDEIGIGVIRDGFGDILFPGHQQYRQEQNTFL